MFSLFFCNNQDFVWISRSNDNHLQPIFGIILFTLAYYHQYIAHVTLANLRKGNDFLLIQINSSVKVSFISLDPKNKQKHSLPESGLFNYVSCPNFLCEIIIYVSLYIILGFNHYPWALITFWVITNQVCPRNCLANCCLTMQFAVSLIFVLLHTCRLWLLQCPIIGINPNSRNFRKQEKPLFLLFTDIILRKEINKYKLNLRCNEIISYLFWLKKKF